MTVFIPPPTPEQEQATGPGWRSEDPERDALLDQSPHVTYQGGGLVAEPVPEATP